MHLMACSLLPFPLASMKRHAIIFITCSTDPCHISTSMRSIQCDASCETFGLLPVEISFALHVQRQMLTWGDPCRHLQHANLRGVYTLQDMVLDMQHACRFMPARLMTLQSALSDRCDCMEHHSLKMQGQLSFLIDACIAKTLSPNVLSVRPVTTAPLNWEHGWPDTLIPHVVNRC